VSQEDIRGIAHDGWIRTILQLASIVFLAGVGWAQLANLDTRLDKLEMAQSSYVASSIGRIERLTAIETKLDFILRNYPQAALGDMIPTPSRR
jgi:hypothetical protein